ncbi:MAG: citryl-CoA lyase [Acidobacteria bacterium]|nr:citryl-CoA lyase [Acidobacteriota bacterium]MBI3263026.1 citryl-CoA lyase [Acidobacteriota bacterium]
MTKQSRGAEGSRDRRAQPRSPDPHWRTALTAIEPNKILIRGYPVDELMGRLDFGEAVYLLLRGELPSPSIGKLMGAVLVSSLDHGVTPPSTLASRNVATTGTSLQACVAAGILGFGPYHGGDIESCMRFLDTGLGLVRNGMTYEEAAHEVVEAYLEAPPPGFGHRIHTQDPRTARLFQMAHELELDGEHIRMIGSVERVLNRRHGNDGTQRIPINVDGAIAAVCADLGFDPAQGNALFIISRVTGLVGHALEEQSRQTPMRQIDPKDLIYDGPADRRLPETRK